MILEKLPCFKQIHMLFLFLPLMIFSAGCASTNIAKGNILSERKLPYPQTIWVCDFVPATKDMEANLAEDNKKGEVVTAQKPEVKKLAVQLGKSISAQLIKKIDEMGLKAEAADAATKPQINDIVLRGYLYGVKSGNATKRIFIGMGYGASTLNTLLEGYQMTSEGLCKLSSANIEAIGDKAPGGGVTSVAVFILTKNPVGLIVAPAVNGIKEMTGGPTLEGRAENTASKIAEVLKVKFQKVGWIKAEN